MFLNRSNAAGVVTGLVLGLLGAVTQAQQTYYWNGTASVTNWNVNASWLPASGYPTALDTAVFTGTVARIVNLNGNQAAATITITNAAAWTFNPTGNTQTVSLEFNHDSTATSTFNAVLSGPMALNVSAGRLLLSNNTNNFNGGIAIKGGTLVAAAGVANTLMGTLGDTNQTITLGGAGVTADSILELYGRDPAGLVYRQPLSVPAGPGNAFLVGSAFNGGENGVGILYTNVISLSDDLTVANNTQRAGGYCDRRVFLVKGAITGTGNLVKDGVGIVQFDNDSGYSGTTTVKNGWHIISGGVNTFTGAIHVDGGMLVVNTDARLGNAANPITLGSTGRFGVLAPITAELATSRTLTLEGNGGILGSHSQNLTFNGPLGGSGRLVVDHVGNRTYLNGTNTYSGGTKVYMGRVFARNDATALGTGNVVVDGPYGLLTISGANSVNAGAKVLVNGGGTFAMPANITAVPSIDTNSAGQLGFYGISGAAVNTRLASPIGNGYMFIASTRDSSDVEQYFTFTGTNLAIGAENTYRFLAGSYGLVLDSPLGTGVLVDNGATPANVLCTGGWLSGLEIQPFTGRLTVRRGAVYQGYALASGSAMGGSSGPVDLAKATLYLNGGYVNNSAPVTKGVLTHEAASQVSLNRFNGNGISLTVSSLNRTNNGCLQLWITSVTNLGLMEKCIVATPPVSSGGMVAPDLTIHSAVTDGNQDFADYVAPNGFTSVVYTINGAPGMVTSQANFDSTIAADIVKVTNSNVAIGGPKTLKALKTNMAITGAGNTLTLASGGLILTGADKTHDVNLATAGELVVTVGGTGTGNKTRNTLSGTVTATGLTKTGKGTLVLTADNSATLSGDIALDQGSLEISNDNQLGNTANRIILNNDYGSGWTDGFRLTTTAVTLPATRTIVLGGNGGMIHSTVYSVTIAAKITGTGSLYFWGSGAILTNPNNDYSGGTWIKGGVTLNNGAQLGTGPVTLQNALNIADNINRPNRFILGNDISGSQIGFSTTAPQVGSLEGGMLAGGSAGQQTVHMTANNAMLTVGGNDQSTDLFAAIMDNDNANGTYGNSGIVKTGTGTFTLWGLNTYHGPTVVTNGTLVVNNLLHPSSVVKVYPGATLDGIGTVGMVSNLGGTVKGNLVVGGLSHGANSLLQVTLNGSGAGQYNAVTVNGPVTLNGGTVQLTLNFKPVVGQTFTIINNDGSDPVVGALGSQVVFAEYQGRIYRFIVRYNGNDGNDVVLEVPATGTVFSVR
jgi:autotransporter-associated beta strand protein